MTAICQQHKFTNFSETTIKFYFTIMWLFFQTASCKNSVWPPRRPLWGGSKEIAVLMVKIVIATIQVNLVPNPSEIWRNQHKFVWILISKIFAISLLPSRPFLSCPLGFCTMSFLGAAHYFSAGMFWIN